MQGIFEIDGACPGSLGDVIEAAVKSYKIILSENLLYKFEKSRKNYLTEAQRRTVYGYCTGLGSLYKKSSNCPPGWEEVVLEEHSSNVGSLIAKPELVRLFLLIRLLQLSKLPAPVRPEVVNRIVNIINKNIIPVIHVYGSVGASGDLSPSAEAFRCIFYGKGLAWYKNEIIPCMRALQNIGFEEKLELEPGETLALINNTAWSTSLCLYGILTLSKIIEETINAGGNAIRISGANPEHYNTEMILSKNCPYGAKVAEKLIKYTTSKMKLLQAPYSIRCLPQLMGAFYRSLNHILESVYDEMCGSSENPSVINGKIYHGCNFHSIRIGLSCDYARIIAGNLANLLDRITAQMMRSEITGLPEFLAGEKSSVGLMITQYTTAAIAGLARGYSHPLTVNSIPTSGFQEDIVPMSPSSAIELLYQLDALIGSLSVLEVVEARIQRLSNGVKEANLGLQDEIIRVYRSLRKRLYPSGSLPFVNEPDYLSSDFAMK